MKNFLRQFIPILLLISIVVLISLWGSDMFKKKPERNAEYYKTLENFCKYNECEPVR